METLPPDVVGLRKEALPVTWPADTRAREMDIPEWLLSVVYKCLRKKSENRFANGVELHEFIINNSIHPSDENQSNTIVPDDIQKLLAEKDQLQQQVVQFKQQINNKETEINELKSSVDKDKENVFLNQRDKEVLPARAKKGVSKIAFGILVFLTIALATFSAYNLFNHNLPDTSPEGAVNKNSVDTTPALHEPPATPVDDNEEKQVTITKKEIKTEPDSLEETTEKPAKPPTVTEAPKNKPAEDTSASKQQTVEVPSTPVHQYMVTAKAYIYNAPDESTRRSAFVVPSNNAILNALEEQNDFILVEFRNQLGQSSKGWLRKKDLQSLNE
jgi:serine/threonine-protein kinase